MKFSRMYTNGVYEVSEMCMNFLQTQRLPVKTYGKPTVKRVRQLGFCRQLATFPCPYCSECVKSRTAVRIGELPSGLFPQHHHSPQQICLSASAMRKAHSSVAAAAAVSRNTTTTSTHTPPAKTSRHNTPISTQQRSRHFITPITHGTHFTQHASIPVSQEIFRQCPS